MNKRQLKKLATRKKFNLPNGFRFTMEVSQEPDEKGLHAVKFNGEEIPQ